MRVSIIVSLLFAAISSLAIPIPGVKPAGGDGAPSAKGGDSGIAGSTMTPAGLVEHLEEMGVSPETMQAALAQVGKKGGKGSGGSGDAKSPSSSGAKSSSY